MMTRLATRNVRLAPWLAIAGCLVVTLCLMLAVPALGQDATQPVDPATQAAAPQEDMAVQDEPALPSEPATQVMEPAPTMAPEPTTSSVPSPVRTARDTAVAVRDAATESTQAVTRGAGNVAEQGKGLWTEALLPMWQRVATSFPSLVKAFLLLLVFWLVALLLGMVVRKVLQATRVDDRAIQDWGLGGMLERKTGEPRSLADVASKTVKWIVLLFGFVAFFQALDLNMVAEPLRNVVDSIVGIIPNLLKAVVILLAYWILAALVRMGLTKLLVAVDFDTKMGRHVGTREVNGEQVGPSAMVGRLAFYLILLFGLPPFLEALGQTALVAPLSSMLAKTLAYLPNIVGAIVLFFIGKIVATIIREVVTNFLAASGVDRGAERLGVSRTLGSRQLSGVIGAIVYFFILISVLVAAVDTLQIRAVSEPVTATLQRLLAAVPMIFVALVVIAIGYAVAKAVKELVESFLTGVGFDSYPQRFGLTFLEPREGRPSLSSIAGTVVMVIILLLTAEQALASLGLDQLATMVGALVGYLPNLLAGVAIILVALSLSTVAARLTGEALGSSKNARIAVPVVRWAIVVLGVSMGLTQLGVGEEIVTIAVGATLAGAALALGLAFGLGGREKAKELIEKADQ